MRVKNQSILSKRRAAFGWVFMIPWSVGFLMFFLYPFLHSIILSFQKVEFLQGGGYSTAFVGLQNYIEAFTKDEKFIPTVASSLVNLLIDVPVCLVFAFFVAVLLNQKFHGNFLAKTVFFLPVILGTGVFLTIQTSTASVSGMAVNSAMNEGTGSMQALQSMNIVNILNDIGVPTEITGYITKPVDRIYSIISMSSVQIFLFLTGLKSISPSLYEAAYVEGASGWVAFWKITFPMVSPVIVVNVVYSLIDNFTMTTNTAMTYIYDMAFKEFNYGLSNAMAWVYCSLLVIIVGVAVVMISKRTTVNQM